MKYVGNLLVTLMNDYYDYFLFGLELMLKGELEGTGFGNSG